MQRDRYTDTNQALLVTVTRDEGSKIVVCASSEKPHGGEKRQNGSVLTDMEWSCVCVYVWVCVCGCVGVCACARPCEEGEDDEEKEDEGKEEGREEENRPYSI